ncbi:Uncharacterized protein ChrSV_4120 [Chromobacterium vaccinii]|nr:Uncharacterized protein ChrSW_4120 [Chromobacterium vaccinii]QND91577.1 Uncharacterized protein ChrSV_4120 [Chromobacterium vaccinii]
MRPGQRDARQGAIRKRTSGVIGGTEQVGHPGHSQSFRSAWAESIIIST